MGDEKGRTWRALSLKKKSLNCVSGQRGSSEVLRIEEQRGESCLLNIGKGSILALTPVTMQEI